MDKAIDLLYTIFEHYLFNALVENETTDEFLTNVVQEYLERLSQHGAISRDHLATIECDLRDEVLEMLRKKTYGHFSLREFRKAHCDKQPPSFVPPTDLAGNRLRRRTS